MRSATLKRSLLAAACSTALALLAGCQGQDSTSEPVDVASTETPADGGSQAAAAASETPAPAQEPLDYGALTEREKPSRLLHFYAEALHRQDWAAAALAWASGAGVSAEALASAYGRETQPTLAVGKGTTEGAAGSLFYEAPAVLDYGDGSDNERGTITLRRSNDVPGASEEQLSWRIKSSTVGPQK